MGKVAIIKSPGDQTIGDKEKAALRDLFIDLIKTRAVTRFTLSCIDDASTYSLPILKELQKKYHHIRIDTYDPMKKKYRKLRESADVVIITMGCAICHRCDCCEIRDNLLDFISGREAVYMTDYFTEPTLAAVSCLPATFLQIYNSFHRGECR